MTPKTWELHAIVKGKVQGVGFRWTVVEHAEHHGLTGTVKNLSNGTVEIIAQGSEAALTAFLKSLRSSPGHAHITSIDTRLTQPKASYSTFKIN